MEVARSADLPAAVGWRGPANHVDAAGLTAVLRSWEHRFGIRVVGFEHSTLHVSVASPPTSYALAQALGQEHYALCPDVFHEYPEADWDAYPSELVHRGDWRFWWD
ncbi:DUF4253 domain-containing protein [Streptomyces wuyuanensis]|uniref:DUF4253 domain-containing protein n=1 Tax=Streptomyces wuyuanensis TaxID=1196353 RepID=UPI00343789AE